MVSIILAAYNGEKYLLPLLDSLKNQSYKNFEVIAVDDCSKDRTPLLLKKYIEKNHLSNWFFYENEKNLGYVLNFKKGISLAKGDILFLCDEDDIWDSKKLEVMVPLFEKKALLIGSSFRKIDGNGNLIPDSRFLSLFSSNHGLIKKKIHQRKKKLSFHDLFVYSFTPGCCMAFSSKIKEDVLSSLESAPHDYLISCLASERKEAYYLNRELISYRLHSSNTIGISNKNDLDERIRICRKDIQQKKEIEEKLKNELSKKDFRFAEKFLSLLNRRLFALENQNLHELKKLFFRTLFMRRYFLTILKDIQVVKKAKNN